MLKNSNLEGPLYDPESKIKNWVPDEDIASMRLEHLRKGTLYSDPRPFRLGWLGDDFLSEDDVEWVRPRQICKRPHFIRGKPVRDDALQGALGDCWFIIAMEALTAHEPLVHHVVPPEQSFYDKYTGAFHFRVWQLGVWYDVVVDDRLPVYKASGQQIFCRSRSGDVFWAALLEKAYAKVNNVSCIDYGSIVQGVATTAFQDLTGGITELVYTDSFPVNGRSIKWFLNELYHKRALIGVQIQKDKDHSERDMANLDLQIHHSYLVTRVFQLDDSNHELYFVKIMNPWGEFEWSGYWSDDDVDRWKLIDRQIRRRINYTLAEDGEFWMSDEDFVRYFTLMCVCHLGPGQYLSYHQQVEPPTWSTTSFHDRWIKGVNAGGPQVPTIHLNPQKKIVVTSDNDVNRDSKCTVVIEVTQRKSFNRRYDIRVGFYVYALKDEHRLPRLEKDFFSNNTPIHIWDISLGQRRGYVAAMHLHPGWYCIVPCTEFEDQETSFLLRVFAESKKVEYKEYGERISKSPVNEEDTSDIAMGEDVKLLFYDAAEKEVLDWIGLRSILEIVMNSSGNQRSSVSNSFWKGSLINPFKDCGNGCITFSKDDCRIMIAMLDQDHSGKLDYHEFCNLWKKILFWWKVYNSFKGSEGYMAVGKLRDSISAIGFNLNNKVIQGLVQVYANEQGRIVLTDFILCGVTLQTVFRRYEHNDKDRFTYTLSEWVTTVLAV